MNLRTLNILGVAPEDCPEQSPSSAPRSALPQIVRSCKTSSSPSDDLGFFIGIASCLAVYAVGVVVWLVVMGVEAALS